MVKGTCAIETVGGGAAAAMREEDQPHRTVIAADANT